MTEDELVAEFAVEMLALHFSADKECEFPDHVKARAKRRIVAMRENDRRIFTETK